MINKKYILCEYRDWAFNLARGLNDVPGWELPLIVTTYESRCDLSDFEARGIPILRINPKIDLKKGEKAYNAIIDIKPDTIFYNSWSWIVPNEILELCPNVTLHPGKLPKGRGGSPIQNQIRNGDTWTYANILKMEEGLDSGPVYLREKISLEGDVDDVWARMIATGCKLTREYLTKLAQGNFNPSPQADEEPAIYKRVKPKQSELKPEEQTALEMHNVIRAHSETDSNTYVKPAYLVVGDKRLIIDRSSLDEQVEKEVKKNVVLTAVLFEREEIFKLCAEVNNKQASLALEDKFGDKVYLTRFYVKTKNGNNIS